MACLVAGLACLLLPLVWPDVFFPLAWGSLVFLLEPWNRRHARRSVLRDLEAGEAGPLVRTLLAGLVCGFLWELWNFWARTKWVYTVPGVEALKVFEMPLLGFLGFPPFAVECLSAVHFLEAWRERTESLPRARRRILRWGTIAVAVAATGVVFAAADSRTVDSIYAPVERLELLPARDRDRLVGERVRESGGAPPDAFDRGRACANVPSARASLPKSCGDIRERVALVMHRGLGPDRARELATLGIHTRDELAAWTPERLAAAQVNLIFHARSCAGPDGITSCACRDVVLDVL